MAIEQLISDAGFTCAKIFGIGSLIGAQFTEGRPMECPISEVLVGSDAIWNGSLRLPMHCVDIDNQYYFGNVVQGGGPVLVTFELMIIETDL